MSGELKYTDYQQINIPITQSINGVCQFALHPLANIIQGVDNNMRVGRVILVTSYELSITIRPNLTPQVPWTARTFPAMTVMVKVIRDDESTKDSNAALISTDGGLSGAEGVLQANTPVNAPTEANALAFSNLDNRKRYTSLYSREFVLDPYTVNPTSLVSASDAGTCKHLHVYKNLRQKVIYGGTVPGAMAPNTWCAEGALYFYVLGTDYPSPQPSPWVADVGLRIRFTDE